MERLDFKALKAKVGVDDIAYSLGYRLDKRAGVGAYIEMVRQGSNGKVQDTIIIKNPKHKDAQMFFRRSGIGVGDVIALIRENIHDFNITGRNEWDIVSKVLAKFANEPLPEIANSAYLDKAGYAEYKDFDINRYEVYPVKGHELYAYPLFKQRGLSESTVNDFAPFLYRVRSKDSKYPHFNVGFPYTEPGKDNLVGFEIRGLGGFKSKAAGTNSTTGAWIVDLSQNKNPFQKKNIYFAESAFDIMAFYQANKQKLDKESSIFVSIGGTFSDKQITGIMEHFSQARAYDCFDNDLPGRMYGVRMAALLEKISLKISREGENVHVTAKNKTFDIPESKFSLSEVSKLLQLRYRVGQLKAPTAFKDWNDVVMNKPIRATIYPNRFQLNEKMGKSSLSM